MLSAPQIKPDIRLEPIPKRPPERKRRVTIAAGMLCRDGIVLCADTELTLSSMKASRGKIFITADHVRDCRMAIVGAGDYDYCKAAIQYTEPLFSEATEAPDLNNMQSALGDAASDVYVNHIYPNRLAQRDMSLMAAMWRKGEGFRLVKTSETAVIRIDSYEVLGSGGEIAEYILKRSYQYDMSVAHAVAVAIYMMSEVKQRGQGCGGETHVAVLREDGELLSVLPEQVTEYEQTTEALNRIWQLAFGALFNLEVSQERYESGVDVIAGGLRQLRGPMVMSEVLRRANPDKSEREVRRLYRESKKRVHQRSKRGLKAQPPSRE